MARSRSYRVSLSPVERKKIQHAKRKANSDNRRVRYAIILAADEKRYGHALTYKKIAAKAGASIPTVVDTLKKFCTGGITKAVTPLRNPNSDTSRLKVTGADEARIIAKACSAPPEGYCRWTLKLLDQEVILEEPVSISTIGRVLRNNALHPHLDEYWCIPPEEDPEFVARMEDILDIYEQPYDPKYPLWCIDEKPYQILGETREPLPMRPGDIKKIDSEYKRNGTVSIFCFIKPHTGEIRHSVEETRTAVDFAEKLRFLVDVIEPEAEKITLVMDNLNTHSIASLYKAFPPEEAARIRRKLYIHYTPVHGSWLDIAEIGINIMTRECLDRRIPSIESLRSEMECWNTRYNENPSPVNWQFTTKDARLKLRHLHPDIDKYRNERNERRLKKIQKLEELQE